MQLQGVICKILLLVKSTFEIWFFIEVLLRGVCCCERGEEQVWKEEFDVTLDSTDRRRRKSGKPTTHGAKRTLFVFWEPSAHEFTFGVRGPVDLHCSSSPPEYDSLQSCLNRREIKQICRRRTDWQTNIRLQSDVAAAWTQCAQICKCWKFKFQWTTKQVEQIWSTWREHTLKSYSKIECKEHIFWIKNSPTSIRKCRKGFLKDVEIYLGVVLKWT
jgi:hypothetical protein